MGVARMITKCVNLHVTIVDMKFNDWILEQLSKKNWSQADLARQSGLTRGAVSNYINGRIPNDEGLQKIAKAFDVPVDFVYEKAGILAPKNELSTVKRSLLHLAENMPDSDVELALALLEKRAEYYKQNPQARPEK
jgi:transcriptional regulator with XRE-family HTH domain